MNTILQALFSPKRAFIELKQESKFPAMAMIILLLLVAVNLILMVPVTSKITTLMLTRSSMPIPEQQLERSLDILYKLRYLQVIGGIFSSAVSLFLYALLLFIITLIVKPALTYIKSFIIIVYGYFAVILGGLVNTGILYFKGMDSITNPFEIAFTGLNLLTTMEKAGGALYTFLSLVNPFQLWFVVIICVGLKVFTDIKYAKALLIGILFWLITVIYPVVAVLFAEMTMQRAGMM
jgi:hypothetical protein